ncbi:phosphoribosylamine--glycine ligase [Liquorilactobacillus satsumensis]|uniref:phosphoribosylamine--glycine ligase n=1 Tax=Liquorilactobacillus satsumensis TaxID=259059 RepID=UPI0021C2BC6E|nr:phosphoribosylamine--glycine ligase [Liquorilactobacillus satsumensis]MCP9327543.1 phosphoribosylamine--glycine ligase [Liquorilactobacillus satsumensis]
MDNKLKILVIGAGAREHAICRAFLDSPRVDTVYCAPGNAGMQKTGVKTVPLSELDFTGLKKFVQDKAVDWTFVGPEDALVAGITDSFKQAGLKIFGPAAAAAQLEGSKDFALQFMTAHQIPTARYQTFREQHAALAALSDWNFPLVIKADGLAAGKGVTICQEHADAVATITHLFANGEQQLVFEEFLEGQEYSLFVVVNKKGYQILPLAQDHKRAYEHDKGPNTGGMGAYSPVPQLAQADYQRMITEVVEPSVQGLRTQHFDYVGVLYIGLILTTKGPKVIEYNVRLGDPETQVVLPRLKTDFATFIDDCLNERVLKELEFKQNACLGVVIAAQGYPQNPQHGQLLPALTEEPGIMIDYANVVEKEGELMGNGGRLFSVIASAATLPAAQQQVYAYIERLALPGCFYRKDIGAKALR